MISPNIDSSIPVIDLTDFLRGTDPMPTALAIGEACEKAGFFQVVGHGFDPALLAGVVATMQKLIALPDEVLLDLQSPTGHPFRGVGIKRSPEGDISVFATASERV